MRLLLTDAYVKESYPHLGREEILSDQQRTHLALLGLHAVDPVRGGSVDDLRAARLPDGSSAFTSRELRHMRDVRAWLRRLLVLELVVAVALVVAALRARLVLAGALRWAGLATLALGVVAVVGMLLDFGDVLLGFHKLLFEGDSWHFSDQDTLIRVYPERFWSWTGIAIALLVLLQAALAFTVGQAIERANRTARA